MDSDQSLAESKFPKISGNKNKVIEGTTADLESGKDGCINLNIKKS